MHTAGVMRRFYTCLRSWLPVPLLRKGLQLLPRRLVVTRRELGLSYKYAIYPRSGGDFGLLWRHETEARHLLPSIVRPGDIVLDIGAHHGLYTLLLAHLVGQEGVVHAFEPHPDNVHRLNENIELNRLSNTVVVPWAVSDSSGTALFNYGNSPFVSSLKRISGQKDDWHQVETVSVDDYLHDLDHQRVGFVKIDVRGAEDLVLRGMRNTLTTHRPTILLEFYQFAFDEMQGAELFTLLFDQQGYVGRVLFRVGVRKPLNVSYRGPIGTFDALMDVTRGGRKAGLLLQLGSDSVAKGKTRKD